MMQYNITRFTIENGDTLEDPQILNDGQIRQFDRMLANPPFSQNYSRARQRHTVESTMIADHLARSDLFGVHAGQAGGTRTERSHEPR